MKISLIAAMGFNRVIGKENRMPWHMPADMRHFRSLTLGKPVIMGRNTFESIGKPLVKRTNIVVTSATDYEAPGCTVVHTLDGALAATDEADEVMVIGGARLYEQFLPQADRLYLTLIEAKVEGDTFFPEYTLAEWEEVSREPHDADAANPYPYTFMVFHRRKGD